MQHQQSSSSKLTNYLLDYADFSLTNRQLMYYIQMSIDFGLTDQATNQIETGKGEEPLRQSHTEKSPVTPGEKEVTTVTPVQMEVKPVRALQKELTPLQMESSVVTPMRGGQKKASTVTPVQMESSAEPRVRTAQKEVSPTTQVKVESSPVAAAQKNTLPVIAGQVEMGYYVLRTQCITC